MIRLGLRLTFSGGCDALIRLIVLTVAVGLGVGLLLTAISAINAVSAAATATAKESSPAGTQRPGASAWHH